MYVLNFWSETVKTHLQWSHACQQPTAVHFFGQTKSFAPVRNETTEVILSTSAPHLHEEMY